MSTRWLTDDSRRRMMSTARARIWRAARILRRFTLAELATVAMAGQTNCFRYIAGLRGQGIIRVVFTRRNGSHSDGPTIFELVQDRGPLPPIVCDDGRLLDYNLFPTGRVQSIEEVPL
ncbi:MAG: hypothetical protein ACYDC3_10375 [Candidatus Binataceae bacterium]